MTKHYTYLMFEEGNYEQAKVGYAKNIDERRKALQTGNPRKIICGKHNEYPTEEQAREAEKSIKYTLTECGLKLELGGGTEWFRYEDNVLLYEQLFKQTYFEVKELKRETKTTLTLENKIIEVLTKNDYPNCFFYGSTKAGIMKGIDDTVKAIEKGNKVSHSLWRTMAYPTNGKKLLIDGKGNLLSDDVDRVFISQRKHEENLALNRFIKNKKGNSLEEFYF